MNTKNKKKTKTTFVLQDFRVENRKLISTTIFFKSSGKIRLLPILVVYTALKEIYTSHSLVKELGTRLWMGGSGHCLEKFPDKSTRGTLDKSGSPLVFDAKE